MHDKLIPVLGTDKNGIVKTKWVRPAGTKPPSQANSHRREYYKKMRAYTVSLIGDCCVHCGYSDLRALQIDHVSGNAFIDKEHRGGGYYRAIAKRIKAGEGHLYQILCANCNIVKKIKNNETFPLPERLGK